MEPPFQPLVPAPIQPIAPAPVAAVETRPSGVRRAILTAAISGLLLVAGGVAVVSAASPEPSASPSTVRSLRRDNDSPVERRHNDTAHPHGHQGRLPEHGRRHKRLWRVRRVLDHAEHHPEHGPDAGHLNLRLAVRLGEPPGLVQFARSRRTSASARRS